MFEEVYTDQGITLGYPENNYKEREKGEIKEVDI